MIDNTVTAIIGFVVGVLLMATVQSIFFTLGGDKVLIPKLIEKKCGEYDSKTGEFKIKNLLAKE